MRTPLYRYLRNDQGEHNAIGDYSAQPEAFGIAPARRETIFLRRLFVAVRWEGPYVTSQYGAIPELGRGVKVHIVDRDGLKLDLLDDDEIHTDEGWGRFCFDTNLLEYGDLRVFHARWSFWKDFDPNNGLELNGRDGERFEIVLNDDFSRLTLHTFNVRGILEIRDG